MNLPRRRLLLCALAVPVLGPVPGQQALTFDPAAETVLGKTLETAFDFALEDFSLVVDGEDIGAIMGGFDMAVTTEQTIVVRDLYVELGDGRPQVLERTFEELDGLLSLSFISEFGEEDQEMVSASDLEGRTVRFVWNEESDGYDATFKDDESDADLLEHLTEDMDFRVLLPEGEVEEGASWSVPLDELESVAAPGGNMQLVPEEAAEVGDYSELEDMFSERFGDMGELLEGEWECTFQGLSAEDPGHAEIGIITQVEASVDFADIIVDVIDLFAQEAGEEEIPDITVDTANLTFEFEGEGLLVWNVAEGRFASYELSGEVILSVDLAVSMEAGGESHQAELYLEMSGAYDQGVTAAE